MHCAMSSNLEFSTERQKANDDSLHTLVTCNSQSIHDELLKLPLDLLKLKEALRKLQFKQDSSIQNHLKRLKEMTPHTTRQNCGMKIYSLDGCNEGTGRIKDIKDGEADTVSSTRKGGFDFLGIQLQNSTHFYERNCYEPLYQTILMLWEDPVKIILAGDTGIGKSFFQLFLLRRLLNDDQIQFRFVVRQLAETFYLYDLATCHVWEIIATNKMHVKKQLNSLHNSIYLFDPRDCATSAPLTTCARSLSTLSFSFGRIHNQNHSAKVSVHDWMEFRGASSYS
jgi:hypothetical protein